MEGDRRHRRIRLGRPPRCHPHRGRTRRDNTPDPGRVGALSDYLRWEHACPTVHIEAGEDIRWLSRTNAADLILPGADCWLFTHRDVRGDFKRGAGTHPRHYTFD